MEEQEDLTLERTIQENEWNIRYAMRTMHEAIWVKQQLIQIQQDRLDQSPSHDTNIRAELRATQRMIREAKKLTSTAKDLLTVYSWHKETWQRRREETERRSSERDGRRTTHIQWRRTGRRSGEARGGTTKYSPDQGGNNQRKDGTPESAVDQIGGSRTESLETQTWG